MWGTDGLKGNWGIIEKIVVYIGKYHHIELRLETWNDDDWDNFIMELYKRLEVVHHIFS